MKGEVAMYWFTAVVRLAPSPSFCSVRFVTQGSLSDSIPHENVRIGVEEVPVSVFLPWVRCTLTNASLLNDASVEDNNNSVNYDASIIRKYCGDKQQTKSSE